MEIPGEAGHHIRLYDFASGELQALLKGHENVITSLAFSPDGETLISGSQDNNAIIWDVRQAKLLRRLKGHANHIYVVGFTPDGARAVTGAYDNELRLWFVADGKEIARMTGHGGKVRSLAIAQDGTIASGDFSGEIRLWDGKTGKFLRTLGRQESEVGSLAFSPDGQLLLSTCGGGPPCGSVPQIVWAVASGKRKAQPKHHDNVVMAAAISHDGRWAATAGGNNNEIYLWDLQSGVRRNGPNGSLLALAGAGQPVWSVGVSVNSREISWGNRNANLSGITPINDRGPLQFALSLPRGTNVLGAPYAVTETARIFRRATARLGERSLSVRKGGDYGDDAILDIKQGGRVVASIERGSTERLWSQRLQLHPRWRDHHLRRRQWRAHRL